MLFKKRFRSCKGEYVHSVTDIIFFSVKRYKFSKKPFNPSSRKIDWEKYKDKKISISETARLMVPEYLSKRKENLLLEWEKTKWSKSILVGKPLLSEIHQFGGTIDWYGNLNGEPTLIEFEYSNKINEEMLIKILALRTILINNGYEVEEARILRFGRWPYNDFEDRLCEVDDLHWKIFKVYLEINKIQEVINIRKGEPCL
jgi:hypothetical protein